jgi:NMD protein affecting ribosome stability and mRNA decay
MRRRIMGFCHVCGCTIRDGGGLWTDFCRDCYRKHLTNRILAEIPDDAPALRAEDV